MATFDCASDRVVASEQDEANSIGEVLPTVSRLSATMRVRLSGGPANQAADVAPLPTQSVEAFKAYVTGYNLMLRQPLQALAMMQKAVQLDPDFADAWYFLSVAHLRIGETERERADLARAFVVRNGAAGAEKRRIEAMYYLNVTGEIYKAIDALRVWESGEPNLSFARIRSPAPVDPVADRGTG